MNLCIKFFLLYKYAYFHARPNLHESVKTFSQFNQQFFPFPLHHNVQVEFQNASGFSVNVLNPPYRAFGTFDLPSRSLSSFWL